MTDMRQSGLRYGQVSQGCANSVHPLFSLCWLEPPAEIKTALLSQRTPPACPAVNPQFAPPCTHRNQSNPNLSYLVCWYLVQAREGCLAVLSHILVLQGKLGFVVFDCLYRYAEQLIILRALLCVLSGEG